MRAIAANVRRRSRACRGFRATARGLDGPSGPPSGRSRACHASRADFGGTRPRTGLDGHGGPPALTGRTRARPTRFREPPRPPSAARLPRDALSGSRAWALAGGPDPPLPQALARALPAAHVCRRRPRLGGACPSRPPPAFRRAPASRFPTCPARLGRSPPSPPSRLLTGVGRICAQAGSRISGRPRVGRVCLGVYEKIAYSASRW